MKQFNLIIFICALLAAVACSEETDLRSKGEHFERLAVEAVLTDQADRPQRVILSKTVPGGSARARPAAMASAAWAEVRKPLNESGAMAMRRGRRLMGRLKRLKRLKGVKGGD